MYWVGRGKEVVSCPDYVSFPDRMVVVVVVGLPDHFKLAELHEAVYYLHSRAHKNGRLE